MFYSNTSTEYIQSRNNPTIVSFSKLNDKKYRQEFGCFLCEGDKLVEEAATYGTIEDVIISETSYLKKDNKQIDAFEKAISSGARPLIVSDQVFEKISTEHAPQGIIAITKNDSISNFSISDVVDTDKILCLDSVRDPGNVGAIIRTAVAFGFNKIILFDSVDITNPKVVRAAMGAIFKIQTCIVENIIDSIEKLKNKNRRIVASALTDNSKSLGEFDLNRKDIVVIGNEGHGISKGVIDVCDDVVKIPIKENTESLNASIAASIFLWEQNKNN